jgi:transcriptional regulator with XRE-family HTH domain
MDDVKIERQFGSNVRQRRTELNLSQEELASRCGLHRTYVGAVERGERNISLRNICALAEALECRPAELLADIVLSNHHDSENDRSTKGSHSQG